MGLGQKFKIDKDQRLHRDGGVQGNRDKLIFFRGKKLVIKGSLFTRMLTKKSVCMK